MYSLCEKYYKSITEQYYLADCISWVPRLTLLNWWTHFGNWTHSYVRDLLHSSQPMKEMSLLFLFYRWENWSLERKNKSAKATELVSGEARIPVPAHLSQAQSPSTELPPVYNQNHSDTRKVRHFLRPGGPSQGTSVTIHPERRDQVCPFHHYFPKAQF